MQPQQRRICAFVGLLVIGFATLAALVLSGRAHGFDASLLRAVRSTVEPGHPVGPRWLEEAARDLTALGSTLVLALIVGGFAGAWLSLRRRAEAGFLIVSSMGGTLVSNGLKMWFQRPRPQLPDTPAVFTTSFPSGRAMLSMVAYLSDCAGLASTTACGRFRTLCFAYALLLSSTIGFSRISGRPLSD